MSYYYNGSYYKKRKRNGKQRTKENNGGGEANLPQGGHMEGSDKESSSEIPWQQPEGQPAEKESGEKKPPRTRKKKQPEEPSNP